MLVLATLLAAAPGARAAVGDLTFGGCFTQSQLNGCTDISGTAQPLAAADSVAISADGRHLYVSGIDSKAISHWIRDPADGSVAFRECWGHGTSGCIDLSSTMDGLDGVHWVTLSPDGLHLYAIAINSDTVTHFLRDPVAGGLTFQECIGQPGTPDDGCEDIPVNALEGGHTIVISPDGQNAYTTAFAANAVASFSRDVKDGSLEFQACHAEGLAGCTETNVPGGGAANAMTNPHWLTIGPEGDDVYVAGQWSDAVSHFDRDPDDGTLTFAGCIGQSAAGGCEDNGPAEGLEQVHGVQVSPDGRHVYAVAMESDAVTLFRRDEDNGALVFGGCWATDAAGCVDLSPARPLTGAHSVEFSADGRSLYAGAIIGNSIAHFLRDTSSGDLTMSSCIGEGTTGCVSVQPARPFTGLAHAAVSPDGADVYAAAFYSATLVRLSRELPPQPVAPAGGPGGAAAPARASAPRGGALISRRRLVLSRSGRVLVTIACPGGGPTCAGALSLRRAAAGSAARRPVLLGSRRFTLAAGRSAKVAVRLTRRARALVRRARRLRVRVSVRVEGAPTATRLLSLRAR
jgi:6-phosphogluconolactonase (cycloisomerase 2 family)